MLKKLSGLFSNFVIQVNCFFEQFRLFIQASKVLYKYVMFGELNSKNYEIKEALDDFLVNVMVGVGGKHEYAFGYRELDTVDGVPYELYFRRLRLFHKQFSTTEYYKIESMLKTLRKNGIKSMSEITDTETLKLFPIFSDAILLADLKKSEKKFGIGGVTLNGKFDEASSLLEITKKYRTKWKEGFKNPYPTIDVSENESDNKEAGESNGDKEATEVSKDGNEPPTILPFNFENDKNKSGKQKNANKTVKPKSKTK